MSKTKDFYENLLVVNNMMTAAKKTGDFTAYRQLKELTDNAIKGNINDIERVNQVARTLERMANEDK